MSKRQIVVDETDADRPRISLQQRADEAEAEVAKLSRAIVALEGTVAELRDRALAAEASLHQQLIKATDAAFAASSTWTALAAASAVRDRAAVAEAEVAKLKARLEKFEGAEDEVAKLSRATVAWLRARALVAEAEALVAEAEVASRAWRKVTHDG